MIGLLRPGRREGRPGRPVHRGRDRRAEGAGHRRGDQDRPGRARQQLGRAAARGSTSSATSPRSCRFSAVAGDQVDLLADVMVGTCRPSRPQLYPDGDAHRRAGAGAGRRADPRGGAGGRPRRAAALDRRAGRGDDPARGAQPTCSTSTPTSTSSGPARRRSCIGHRRQPAARTSAPGPAGRSRRCSARGSTSTCTSSVAKDWQRDPKQLRQLGF